mgnify:CR=1 FL=1
MKKEHVVVVGGGFAGLEAVRAIRRRVPEAAITVIDANPYATMVPALPDVVSGRIPEDALVRPLEEVLDPESRLVIDPVRSVDLDKRLVFGSENEYRYDYLVIANGSKPNYFGFQPQEGGQLHSVHSYPRAMAFREEFSRRTRQQAAPTTVVVGGGYTGLEVAASLRFGTEGSGAHPRILVVELAEDVVPFIPEKTRSKIRGYLESRDIEVRTGTSLEALVGQRAELSDGEKIEDALVCWSAGMRAALEEVEGTVDRTRDGRFVTDVNLALPAHPEVFVAGDAAALNKGGETLRRAVNFSIYSGRQAGKNVAARITERAVRPFKPADLGWVIPLSEISTGKILNSIPVAGSFGLRLHYFMCGFRHFGAPQAWEFHKTALHLSRSPGSMELTG